MARYKALSEGLVLFNQGAYYASHEIWEHQAWLTCPVGLERTFYQMLIQLAAAFFKAEQGNSKGYKRLLEVAFKKLEGYLFLFRQETICGISILNLYRDVALLRQAPRAAINKITIRRLSS